MVDRVAVAPRLLAWAIERSRLDRAALSKRFPKLEAWEQGEASPTAKQLDAFARATHTPVDLLLRDEPRVDVVPITDRRAAPPPPGADLLDAIADAQQRQAWYRGFARSSGERAVELVGSLTVGTPVGDAGEAVRSALSFDVADRGSNWTIALRRLAEHAEERGVLVMTSGVVGSSTRRKLVPDEFRGFVLADRLAPVVFVNGGEPKAGQLFTLLHGLVHLFVDDTALFDAGVATVEPADGVERWCSEVTLEALVPSADLEGAGDDVEKLAKRFRTSPLVVLRRLHDAGRLDGYDAAHRAELARMAERAAARPAGGGNFYATQPIRVSKRFARAVVASTLEGRTDDQDAFRMLGFRKRSTLEELARRLGVG
jgi:Zn-dependent peptidase ImmA (M78 family)